MRGYLNFKFETWLQKHKLQNQKEHPNSNAGWCGDAFVVDENTGI